LKTFRIVDGGEKVNAGKVILGALTIIGLLADIIDDD
jgi:hypothetical protein